MKIYKTRWFSRWAKKEDVSDDDLCSAVTEIVSGLIDANLGGYVYKKRIPLAGRGKRGGARTLIAYNKGNIIFFVYGFSKSEKDNIDEKELQALKGYASELMSYKKQELNIAVKAEKLIEVVNDERT